MMICCNTGARTRRLMMTRARFRAYGVHRVLDELLEVLGIRQSDFRAPGRTEPPSRIEDLDGDEEETPSKYYCTWKILSPRISPIPMHSCEIRPHVAGRTRVQYQTRKQLEFLSPTSPPIIHLDLKTNYNLVCREEGFDFCGVEKISSDLSLSLFFSLLHARACTFDETTSYFSLIFMLIGEFPYLPVFTWYIIIIIITLIANINIGSDNVLPRGARGIPEKFIRLARTFCALNIYYIIFPHFVLILSTNVILMRFFWSFILIS